MSKNKTWFLDIDGTLLKHRNNVQIGQSQDSGKAGTVDDGESLLPAVNEFLDGIPETDQIVLTTARKAEHREITEKALERFGIMKKVVKGYKDYKNSAPWILKGTKNAQKRMIILQDPSKEGSRNQI